MKISDIAKLAGVSVATVSRTINNDPRVAAKSAKKVMAVVNKYNYVPNVTGRSLRTSKTNIILVALPTISNTFYSQIVKGIEQCATKYSYNIIVAPTQADVTLERKYLNMLISHQVDGYISFFSSLSCDEINKLSKQYPYVQACEITMGADVSHVMINNVEAAYESVNLLIKKGHRRIGMLSGRFYEFSSLMREEGYYQALRNNDIEIDPGLVVISDYTYHSGEESCQKLMDRSNPPTALFCVCDDMAIGAIRYLASIGLKAGQDVDIVGFDNTSMASMYMPTITSVSQPKLDIGITATDLLMEKIERCDSTNKKVILPHKIIFRETTMSSVFDCFDEASWRQPV